MREISQIVACYESLGVGELAALATVVEVEQSSYRRIGARLLVTTSGRWVGGISGGCLEGDALRRAQEAIVRGRPSLVVYDTREEADRGIGVGLGCNGRIGVLFVPLVAADPNNPIAVLKQLLAKRSPSRLFQLIGGAPLTKQKMGGELYPTAQLTKLAATYQLPIETVNKAAQALQAARQSTVFELVNESGQTIRLLGEWLPPRLRLLVFGDNYDVLSLGQFAQLLGWELHLVGKLRKFTKAHAELAAGLYAYGDTATFPPLDAFSCVLLMTHDYEQDLAALRFLLPQTLPFIGLLGPSVRRDKIKQSLLAEGFSSADFQPLYAPMGLDIGAESPEEIALAILAEIVAVLRQRAAGFLRDRSGSMHEAVEVIQL